MPLIGVTIFSVAVGVVVSATGRGGGALHLLPALAIFAVGIGLAITLLAAVAAGVGPMITERRSR